MILYMNFCKMKINNEIINVEITCTLKNSILLLTPYIK